MVIMEGPQNKIAFITNHHHVVLNTLKATVNLDYARDNSVYKKRQERNGTNHVHEIISHNSFPTFNRGFEIGCNYSKLSKHEGTGVGYSFRD